MLRLAAEKAIAIVEKAIPYYNGKFPRDSSSAAIAVCGILEMIKYIEDEEIEKESEKVLVNDVNLCEVYNIINKEIV